MFKLMNLKHLRVPSSQNFFFSFFSNRLLHSSWFGRFKIQKRALVRAVKPFGDIQVVVQAQFCGLVRHCLIISKRRGHWPLILASSFNNNNMFVIIRASSCLLSFLYNRFKLTSLPIDSTTT